MAASSVANFDDRLHGVGCDSRIRTIVGALLSHIDGCGPVSWLAHESKGGWGIRASVAGRIVCYIDPKSVGNYVAVQVMDAEPGELALAGDVYLRKDAPAWVHVATPEAAATLFPLISRAHATAQSRATAGRGASARRRSPAQADTAVGSVPTRPAVADTALVDAVDVRRVLEALGFRRAGAIRPLGNGTSCVCDVQEVTGFLVYAHVVGPKVMKIGITTPSLRSRASQNASTINQVIALAAGTARPAKWHTRAFDRFKQLAPDVIRSGREIEIWVLESSELAYRSVERDLNARFATLENGWTSRLG